MGSVCDRKRLRVGQVDFAQARRPRYQALLGALGLWDRFTAMPAEIQEAAFDRKLPDPVLDFTRELLRMPDAPALRAEFERHFRAATFDVHGTKIPARDFFAIAESTLFFAHFNRYRPLPKPVLRFCRAAFEVLEPFCRTRKIDACGAIKHAIDECLYRNSRLDTRLLTGILDSRMTRHDKGQVVVRITAEKPQERRLVLDRGSRPAYRAAEITNGKGVRWMSWTAETLGRAGPQEYPVWVQSHALRRLHQRVNLPACEPFVEAWMLVALETPNIVERSGDDLLVEYRIREDRLGYLVVTPLDDCVVVRTFKFLTMANTPEGRALERHANLRRRQIDWLGLNELSAFIGTDLGWDEDLREMFEACGCGHLFTLGDDEDKAFAPEPKPLAETVRKHLRLAA